MEAHVFIDNSNVFGGAQLTSKSAEPEASHFAIRLFYKNLFELVERGYSVKTKILAGSQLRAIDSLWNNARHYGYTTNLLQRVSNGDGKAGEKGVNELVQMKVSDTLRNFKIPQTLILVTGKGNNTDFGTGFVSQVVHAVSQGWEVVIWSWRICLSSKYNSLVEEYPGKIRIELLDPYYFSITSMVIGEFFDETRLVKVAERRAIPLHPVAKVQQGCCPLQTTEVVA